MIKKAITMIELMVVVVIVSIMTAAVTPDVLTYINKKKEETLHENLTLLRSAIAEYMYDHSGNPKFYELPPSFDKNNPDDWKNNIFSNDNNPDNDIHLAFPICLQQLVEDGYIINLPTNTFTGEKDWQVRGFAEPKVLLTSWYKAINHDYSINNNIFPKISINAKRDASADPDIVIGSLVGIYDIRAGDIENNYHADIDSWDERHDGKWRGIIHPYLNLAANPSEFNIYINETIDFSDLISTGALEVSANYSDSSKKILNYDQLYFTKKRGIGKLSNGIYTAPNSITQDKIIIEHTEDALTKYALIKINVSIKTLDYIVINPTSIDVLNTENYNLNNITTTAYYSDGTSKLLSASDLNWTHNSGEGSVSSNIFYANTNPGTATLKCIYTENDISAEALLNVNILRKLNFITLNPSSITLFTNESYNLNTNIVTAFYKDSSSQTITPIWSKISGVGTLTGNSYVSSEPGTTIIRATYEENGITVTADFEINIIRKLDYITLDPSNIELFTSESYYLTSNTVTAFYEDGFSQIVSPTWSKISGSYVIFNYGTKVTASLSPSTAVFRAEYTENDITVTADFNIDVVWKLDHITLNPTSVDLFTGESLDLSTISCMAYYTGHMGIVTPEWSKISGPGYLTGNTYTSANAGTAIVRATYEESGIKKTADLQINFKSELDHITLNPTIVYLNNGDSYDLSSNVVTAFYTDGSSQEIIPTWNKISGVGTLTGNIYMSPNDGTAIVRATYTEESITVTADLKIVFEKKLDYITLTPSTVDLSTGDSYDISNNVVVTAFYTDGSSQIVSPSTIWSKVSGPGSLESGNVYTSNDEGTAIARASYTEGGVTATADLELIFETLSPDIVFNATPGNLYLQFNTPVSIHIDWGSGSPATMDTSYIICGHLFMTSSIVKITGTLGGWVDYNWGSGQTSFVNEVFSFGNIGLKSLSGLFKKSPFNVKMPSNIPATVINLSDMFKEATLFNRDISSWNVSNVTDMSNFLKGATSFSTENYNKLLIEWSKLPLQHGVRFDCSTKYSSGAAATARQYIIDNFGWTINDAGME